MISLSFLLGQFVIGHVGCSQLFVSKNNKAPALPCRHLCAHALVCYQIISAEAWVGQCLCTFSGWPARMLQVPLWTVPDVLSGHSRLSTLRKKIIEGIHVVIKYDVGSLMAWRHVESRLVYVFKSQSFGLQYMLKLSQFKQHTNVQRIGTVLPLVSPALPRHPLPMYPLLASYCFLCII